MGCVGRVKRALTNTNYICEDLGRVERGQFDRYLRNDQGACLDRTFSSNSPQTVGLTNQRLVTIADIMNTNGALTRAYRFVWNGGSTRSALVSAEVRDFPINGGIWTSASATSPTTTSLASMFYRGTILQGSFRVTPGNQYVIWITLGNGSSGLRYLTLNLDVDTVLF